MQCRVVKSFRSRGEIIPPGSIITISPDKLHKLADYVEPLAADGYRDRTQCRFWNKVCHTVGMYQDECTATADSACRIYRFLELNTSEAP